MTSNLARVLDREGKFFIPFVTAGHPDLETTREIILSLAAAGSAVVEVGIPFSDPVADGLIIQKSSFSALQHGYRIADYIELVREVRSCSDVGLIFMTYMNPLLQYGLERLDVDASAAGLDGVLISDLSLEEYLVLSAHDYRTLETPEREGGVVSLGGTGPARPNRAKTRYRIADRGLFRHLDTIFLVAPTSSPERIREICRVSTGFVYLVARTGVTGKQTEIDTTLSQLVKRVRVGTNLPIAVGFGITSKADVEKVWKYADAAVVGSAIVQFIEDHKSEAELPVKLARYVKAQLIPDR